MDWVDAIDLLAVIGAGFSVVSAIILLCAYLLFLPQMEKSPQSKTSCGLVLLGLASLQLLHLLAFIDSAQAMEVLATRLYVSLLMLLPFVFYLFSLYVLFPRETKHWSLALHAMPLLVSVWLPLEVVPAIAFSIGAAYTLWLVTRLVRVRTDRSRFGLEIFFFAMFAAMAILALVLGLYLSMSLGLSSDLSSTLSSSLPTSLPLNSSGEVSTALSQAGPGAEQFYRFYSLSIAIAMASVVGLLIIHPAVLVDVIAITDSAYSDSKLVGIDAQQKLDEVRELMASEKLYEDAALDLSTVATKVALSTHQLSELINRHAGNNFPGFVKAYRIEAARKLLIEEPESSVLAISLQTGFKSQSAFYTAFKDATGKSPGVYRKEYG